MFIYTTGRGVPQDDAEAVRWYGGDFLRAARALALHFPPIQRVEDVSRIEDLSDVPDDELQRMMEIRDAARQATAKTSDDS